VQQSRSVFGARLAGIGLVLVVAGCGGGQGSPEKSGAGNEAPAALVEVVAARPVTGSNQVVATGTFRRERELALSFPINGVLIALNVREGDRVEQGGLLAAIDPTQVDARIAQAQAGVAQAAAGIGQATGQANAALAQVEAAQARAAAASADVARATAGLAQAQASLELAQSDYNRDATLAAQGFVSPARIEAARTRLDVARASAEAARTGVEAARASAEAARAGISQARAGAGAAGAGIQAATGATRAAQAGVAAAAFDRGRARLLAPSAGVILSRSAEPGEVIAPGRSVLTLSDETSPLILRTPVSDRDVARIARGDAASIRIEALGREVTGRVVRVAQQADPRTGAFDVDLAVDQTAGIRTGFLAEARVVASAGPPLGVASQTIPAEALLEATDGAATLYVLAADRRTARLVRVGFSGFRDGQAVVTGLAPGTLVITRGGGFVSNGARVEVTGTGGKP
jgi:multidrug efflux pump subunit AcrA (membrane-fusion protein)